MKHILIAMLLISSSSLIFGQNNRDYSNRNHSDNTKQVPANVQQSWQRDHPNDGNPQWQHNNGQWNAQYQDKNNSRNANTYYDQRGREVDTHRQLSSHDMPSGYNENINKRYKANGNYDVTRIDRPHQKQVYQVRMKNSGKSRTVYTDEHGNEIRYRDDH